MAIADQKSPHSLSKSGADSGSSLCGDFIRSRCEFAVAFLDDKPTIVVRHAKVAHGVVIADVGDSFAD